MSRTNNAGVIDLWQRGFEASSHNGALTSNGVDLFSYNLKIGHRSGTGVCVVGDYTSPGGGFHRGRLVPVTDDECDDLYIKMRAKDATAGFFW